MPKFLHRSQWPKYHVSVWPIPGAERTFPQRQGDDRYNHPVVEFDGKSFLMLLNITQITATIFSSSVENDCVERFRWFFGDILKPLSAGRLFGHREDYGLLSNIVLYYEGNPNKYSGLRHCLSNDLHDFTPFFSCLSYDWPNVVVFRQAMCPNTTSIARRFWPHSITLEKPLDLSDPAFEKLARMTGHPICFVVPRLNTRAGGADDPVVEIFTKTEDDLVLARLVGIV